MAVDAGLTPVSLPMAPLEHSFRFFGENPENLRECPPIRRRQAANHRDQIRPDLAQGHHRPQRFRRADDSRPGPRRGLSAPRQPTVGVDQTKARPRHRVDRVVGPVDGVR